jgi:hypothetical protein
MPAAPVEALLQHPAETIAVSRAHNSYQPWSPALVQQYMPIPRDSVDLIFRRIMSDMALVPNTLSFVRLIGRYAGYANGLHLGARDFSVDLFGGKGIWAVTKGSNAQYQYVLDLLLNTNQALQLVSEQSDEVFVSCTQLTFCQARRDILPGAALEDGQVDVIWRRLLIIVCNHTQLRLGKPKLSAQDCKEYSWLHAICACFARQETTFALSPHFIAVCT